MESDLWKGSAAENYVVIWQVGYIMKLHDMLLSIISNMSGGNLHLNEHRTGSVKLILLSCYSCIFIVDKILCINHHGKFSTSLRNHFQLCIL